MQRDEQYAEAWALVDEMGLAAGRLRTQPAGDLDETAATLLERAVGEATQHIPAWTRPSAGVDDPPALSHGNPERLVEIVWMHFGVEINLARQVLARATRNGS